MMPQTERPSPNDAALARTTAALLQAALPLRWLNLLALLAMLWPDYAGLWPVLVWLAGLLALYYQWRMGLDTALFTALATGEIDTGQLDNAFLALSLRRQITPRSMVARSAGALGLLRRWLLCSLLQALGLLLAIWAA